MNHDLFPFAVTLIVGMFIGMAIDVWIQKHHKKNFANIMVPARIAIRNRVLGNTFERYLESAKLKLVEALADAEKGITDDVPHELVQRKTLREREQWIRNYWIDVNNQLSYIDEEAAARARKAIGHKPMAPYESESPHPIFNLG